MVWKFTATSPPSGDFCDVGVHVVASGASATRRAGRRSRRRRGRSSRARRRCCVLATSGQSAQFGLLKHSPVPFLPSWTAPFAGSSPTTVLHAEDVHVVRAVALDDLHAVQVHRIVLRHAAGLREVTDLEEVAVLDLLAGVHREELRLELEALARERRTELVGVGDLRRQAPRSRTSSRRSGRPRGAWRRGRRRGSDSWVASEGYRRRVRAEPA